MRLPWAILGTVPVLELGFVFLFPTRSPCFLDPEVYTSFESLETFNIR